jgi:HPt (histidine-containing phosphotransfer) domain-containing protein
MTASNTSPDGDEGPATDAASLDRLRRFGGGKLLNEMIALFVTAAPERIAAARAGVADANASVVEMALHALKSSSAQLGAMRMQRLSEQGELIARSGGLENVDALVEQIADEFTRVQVWLDSARNSETA